ncbi:MAG TPA: hypothetical protein VH164_00305 [Ktedonobacteraceae bacterium]|jgi:hypothetical protein|nr:hypothetical protein [Ktedonobacteraceae bacterium]
MPSYTTGKSLGQIAYEAYLAYSGGKSLITGDELPPWEECLEPIKHAWDASAHAAAYEYLLRQPRSLPGESSTDC